MNFLRRIFSVCHSFEVALTFLLQADLQQLSVNYGDLYVGFLNGNPFQRSLRVQVTNETCCLLLAVWVWNFDQLIQFEMLCPLWLRINMLVKQDQNVEHRYLYIELPYLCPNYDIHIQSKIFMTKTEIYVSKLQYLYFHIFPRFSWHIYFLRLDINISRTVRQIYHFFDHSIM